MLQTLRIGFCNVTKLNARDFVMLHIAEVL